MAFDVQQMQADVAPMSRLAAIGYLRRRPGNVEALLDRLTSRPDGSPADFAASVQDLADYGAWLIAAAEAIRGKAENPPHMVKLQHKRRP